MPEQQKPCYEVRESQPEPSATSVGIQAQAPALVASSEASEPPAHYVPACGVLCDIFWWARGK